MHTRAGHGPGEDEGESRPPQGVTLPGSVGWGDRKTDYHSNGATSGGRKRKRTVESIPLQRGVESGSVFSPGETWSTTRTGHTRGVSLRVGRTPLPPETLFWGKNSQGVAKQGSRRDRSRVVTVGDGACDSQDFSCGVHAPYVW